MISPNHARQSISYMQKQAVQKNEKCGDYLCVPYLLAAAVDFRMISCGSSGSLHTVFSLRRMLTKCCAACMSPAIPYSYLALQC